MSQNHKASEPAQGLIYDMRLMVSWYLKLERHGIWSLKNYLWFILHSMLFKSSSHSVAFEKVEEVCHSLSISAYNHPKMRHFCSCLAERQSRLAEKFENLCFILLSILSYILCPLKRSGSLSLIVSTYNFCFLFIPCQESIQLGWKNSEEGRKHRDLHSIRTNFEQVMVDDGYGKGGQNYDFDGNNKIISTYLSVVMVSHFWHRRSSLQCIDWGCFSSRALHQDQ